ncbi:hypothetical protein Daura_22345 [Dactylosporangium aurantiacum]|uniref:Metallo-beta-lactamase domain-containing protein n=1 Tax=Dactylosporangium aurantiacum TaxID=35754 RepID=A0A9Q9INC4_9ACTN|nr:hypothetical protein [Dactylosporangium aurantiacum]MDG6110188.1 hypothetical protein [Dactylosporangium aurantiacum]UWZ58666.1 hypothetical protein Daura_22345 [Dactylosporangium aurantiacum]
MAKSASLEIHVINVSQGDSVLVVNRDLAALDARLPLPGRPTDPIDWVPYARATGISLQGTVVKALLVDAGDHGYGGDVVDYLVKLGVIDPAAPNGYQPNLTMLASHYHDDHFAGLRSVLSRRVKPPKGGKTTYPVLYRPAVVIQEARTYPGVPTGRSFSRFQGSIQNARTPPGPATKLVELLPGGLGALGAPAQYEINLGKGHTGLSIVARVVASGQQMWSPVTGATIVNSRTKEIDHNDRSIVLMLEYGSFRCLLGGDIAGDGGSAGGNEGPGVVDPKKSGKKYKTQHADVESKLEPFLAANFPRTVIPTAGQPKFQTSGYATVLKANHHGSNTSVDTYFLARVRPLIFVVSSGVKARFHRHPTAEVMYRVDSTTKWTQNDKAKTVVPNSINGWYITEVAKTVKGQPFTVDVGASKIIGSTVVRPVDESIQDIQNAGHFNTPLEVQVYGVGVLSDLSRSTKSVRPVVPPANPAGAIYPVGPWTHTDLH